MKSKTDGWCYSELERRGVPARGTMPAAKARAMLIAMGVDTGDPVKLGRDGVPRLERRKAEPKFKPDR